MSLDSDIASAKANTRRKKKVKAALINTTGNKRSGQAYFTKAYKGGEWHIYDNGKKVFVKKKKAPNVNTGQGY